MTVSLHSSQTPCMPYTIVAKEQIPDQLFKAQDVLQNPEAQKMRMMQLHRAFELNRKGYSKARIVFETIIETLEVIDHVWEITDVNVLLKGGITLPIACIREVSIAGAQAAKGSVVSSNA